MQTGNRLLQNIQKRNTAWIEPATGIDLWPNSGIAASLTEEWEFLKVHPSYCRARGDPARFWAFVMVTCACYKHCLRLRAPDSLYLCHPSPPP
jgi:hypothetical protein